ncbi:predicted protein [Sclerotinia sclerotiorum 1980 UF-70]|uniref:Uncharacterized protein n=1 Tax=Sclerotinia sclerotiorum (strain ATCC 18683 / 1980 / Ss-1) TaxID=665079 RepID=A7EQ87_SCLS1|nr:predicted protein [Sclerotinia sclerotiorum 1980 UF-70]EDO05003.1 predicted protein [Sclerotinia sclerotiorum 1980 UF-70]
MIIAYYFPERYRAMKQQTLMRDTHTFRSKLTISRSWREEETNRALLMTTIMKGEGQCLKDHGHDVTLNGKKVHGLQEAKACIDN